MDKRYAAFLSYSQAADGALSAALRDALHELGRPWHRLRALRVFRDNSSLAANEALWPSIQAALGASRFFILLASPQAVTSRWVGREVEYWLERNPRDTLLIAVTAGELRWDASRGDFDGTATTCIPETLYGRYREEPRWVDLRGLPADRLTLRDLQFRDRVADLAAPLHGLGKDDLVGADIRQHRRTQRLVRATIAALTALVVAAGASAVVAGIRFLSAAREQAVAERERERAEARQALAEARHRDALVRQLLAEADIQSRDGSDRVAARLALAALHLGDDAETRASLLKYTIDSHIVSALRGPTEAYGLAYSPDGDTLATSGEDGTVLLWDVSDPYRPLRLGDPLTGHTDRVHDVRFSPDGRLLATAGLDGQVILWDARDVGRPVPAGDALAAHAGGASAAVFSPDQPVLATAGLDGQVILWDITDPGAPAPIGDPLTGHGDEIWSAAFSPDGSLLATGGHDGSVSLWDVGDPAAVAALAERGDEHTGGISVVAFHPDGDRLVTGSRDGTVRIWDVIDPAAPATFGQPYRNVDPVFSVAFSPDGQDLIVGGHGREVDVLGMPGAGEGPDSSFGRATFPPEIVLEQSEAAIIVQRVAYAPDGETIAVATDAGGVTLWDRHPVRVAGQSTTVDGSIAIPSPDGHTLIVGGEDGTVARWDVTDPARPEPRGGPVSAHADAVIAIAFSADGSLAATVGFLDTVRLWDVTDPDEITLIGGPLAAGDVRAVSFSPDARTLAAASTDEGLVLWDITDPASPVPMGLPEPSPRAWTVEFSPDGVTLAVGGLTESTTLWDVRDPGAARHLGDVPRRRSGTYDVAFSPDGSILATGDEDGSIALWDVTGPSRPTRVGRPLTLHADNVRSLTFAPDGDLLASSSFDGTSVLLDLGYPARPVVIARGLTAHPTLAFSPAHATIVASGAAQFPVEIFDFSAANSHREHLVERACAIAGRGLTEPEWEQSLPSIPYHDTCPAV